MAWVNQTEFARLAGVSKPAITKAVRLGRVVKVDKLGIDTEHPTNDQYLKSQNVARQKSRRDKKAPKRPKKLPPASNKAISIEELENFAVGDQIEISESYDLNGNQMIDRATAERLKIIEQARAMQIKREQMRGELVDRKTVSRIMNMLYKIDTGELKPLGDTLAPEIAAICGVDDDEIKHQINERIEKEIYKTLEHIKRRINDGLKMIKAKEIE
jgi:hypothetical protein